MYSIKNIWKIINEVKYSDLLYDCSEKWWNFMKLTRARAVILAPVNQQLYIGQCKFKMSEMTLWIIKILLYNDKWY